MDSANTKMQQGIETEPEATSISDTTLSVSYQVPSLTSNTVDASTSSSPPGSNLSYLYSVHSSYTRHFFNYICHHLTNVPFLRMAAVTFSVVNIFFVSLSLWILHTLLLEHPIKSFHLTFVLMLSLRACGDVSLMLQILHQPEEELWMNIPYLQTAKHKTHRKWKTVTFLVCMINSIAFSPIFIMASLWDKDTVTEGLLMAAWILELLSWFLPLVLFVSLSLIQPQISFSIFFPYFPCYPRDDSPILEAFRGPATPPEVINAQPLKYFEVGMFSTTNCPAQDECSCSICLSDFHAGDPIRILFCGHYFHSCCIEKWLVIKRRCPLCVQRVQRAKLKPSHKKNRAPLQPTEQPSPLSANVPSTNMPQK